MKEKDTLDYIYAEIAHIEDSKDHARLLDMADGYKRDLEAIEKTKDQMELAMITKELSYFYNQILQVTTEEAIKIYPLSHTPSHE